MATVIERRAQQQRNRHFYVGMSTAAAMTVLIGFAPTFFLRGYLPMRPDQPPLSALLLVHGTIGTAWIALFLAQSILVTSHRIAVHKRLGLMGALLAAALAEPRAGPHGGQLLGCGAFRVSSFDICAH
jgi:hypothetical protein